MKQMIRTFIVVAIALLLGFGVTTAVGAEGAHVNFVSVTVWCAIAAFAINWLVYIPSFIAKTEHYYDFTGSLTYLFVIALALYLTPNIDLRGYVAAAMVSVWALRLGSFLFLRVKKDGHDKRFDQIKLNPLRFFVAWNLQALWVILTSIAAVTIITSDSKLSLGLVGIIGMLIWLIGFSIEVIADYQKSRFRSNPSNAGQFINTGLWSRSQHPNYFGEIMLWAGIAIMAVPVLAGWQLLSLISPFFVYLLLRYVSGIPLLEAQAKIRWEGNSNYSRYVKNTPKLCLKF